MNTLIKKWFPAFIVALIALWAICGCDKRTINDKSMLTDHIISKQTIDTTIITDESLFTPLMLAQKKEQSRFALQTKDVDSIHQNNYWLKKVGEEIIETPKRLDKTIMKYKNGKLIYKATYQNDGDLFLSEQFYFDHNGLLLAKHETNSALNLIEQQLIYSKDNIVIGKEHLNGKGGRTATSTVSYSTAKNTYIETTKWLDSETQSKNVKEHNLEGNITKQLKYEALMNKQLTDTTETVFEFDYNSIQKVTIQRQFNTWGMTANYSEALYSTTSYEYDGFGNAIAIKEIKADGSILSEHQIEYKYDSKNNWTKKINYKNGEPESQLVRQIFYSE